MSFSYRSRQRCNGGVCGAVGISSPASLHVASFADERVETIRRLANRVVVSAAERRLDATGASSHAHPRGP